MVSKLLLLPVKLGGMEITIFADNGKSTFTGDPK